MLNATDAEWSEIKHTVKRFSIQGFSYIYCLRKAGISDGEISKLSDDERIELIQAWTYPDDEPKFCVHYSDDCPLCEEQAAIAEEGAKPAPPARPARWMPAFNENDCGGVFDGRGVISDADPGL